MQNKSSDKLSGYLGFAAKARKLQTGYNTGLSLIAKGKAKLVLIAEDAAEGTFDKISGKCRSKGVKVIRFGSSEYLSHITGAGGSTVFTVTDKGFAGSILKEIEHIMEIDRIRSEGE